MNTRSKNKLKHDIFDHDDQSDSDSSTCDYEDIDDNGNLKDLIDDSEMSFKNKNSNKKINKFLKKNKKNKKNSDINSLLF